MVDWWGASWVVGMKQTMRVLVTRAFQTELTTGEAMVTARIAIERTIVPLTLAGGLLVTLL